MRTKTEPMSIREWLTRRLEYCELLLREPEPTPRAIKLFLEMDAAADGLIEKYSERGFELLHVRARALTREVFGGEPAPPAVQMRGGFNLAELDGDIVATEVAETFGRRGGDAARLELLQQRWSAVIAEIERQQAAYREAKRERARAAEQQRVDVVEELRAEVQALRAAATPPAAAPGAPEAVQAADGDMAALLAAAPADGPPLRWRGVWDATTEYKAGEVVTARDALWVCAYGARGVRPGDGKESGWRMILKSPDLRGSSRDRK